MRRNIRYAVVGLGHIAQVAVLPAFAHAGNSELQALVSGDRAKRRTLSRRYRVPDALGYEEIDDYLRSGRVDAVYIALPNDQHRDYTERAAEAGVHVLCEKPLAVREEDCRAMIRAADRARVKLMTAYRLHFEPATLAALTLAQKGRLGDLRFFEGVLSMQVRPGDIRTRHARGGGPLLDVGIYCINAARCLFRDEPLEVQAAAASARQARFREIDEMVAGVLRFPGDRLASFQCSFGAADVSSYRLVGTKGDLRVEPGFEYASGLRHYLRIGGRETVRRFPKVDQFAAELEYFSSCILRDRDPEPSGWEGLADVRIIAALEESLRREEPVALAPFTRARHPHLGQDLRRPPVRKPEVVRARSPHLERGAS